jgi:RNA polymerase sigma-70 factor (ECF subfamily)
LTWASRVPKKPSSVGLFSWKPVTNDELSALYLKYGYLVHRRCASILGETAEAEDALHEVFMRVLRYDRGDAKDSTLAWLYRIASNVCFDAHQRRARASSASPEDLRRVAPHTGSTSDGDRRAVLGAALRRVDPRTREIGLLHHLDGYTQEEVAERVGLSRKTVGRKLVQFDEVLRDVWLQAEHGGKQP